MGLFGRKGQSRRERRAMNDHLKELDRMRAEELAELGRMVASMSARSEFDHSELAVIAEEVVKTDREADLIARGLEEGLTVEELEDLARREENPAEDSSR